MSGWRGTFAHDIFAHRIRDLSSFVCLAQTANICRDPANRSKDPPTPPTTSACRGQWRPCPRTSPPDFEIAPHSHERAQLIYATAGTMRVAAAGSMWIVPPQRALWMPAGIVHGIAMLERRHHAHPLPARRRGRRHAARLPRAAGLAAPARADRARDGAAAATTTKTARPAIWSPFILAELHGQQSLPLHLPMPRSNGGSRRSAVRCSISRATGARWANGRAPCMPASAPWPGSSSARRA